jgi:uncharacterized protein
VSRLPEFQQYQFAFAARIRNPRVHLRPNGVAARRMKVYEELVFNNLQGFLLACYPVLRKVLGKRRWTALVRQFLHEHRCHTPLFRQIPEEFLRYLNEERTPQPEDPPFLQELAHYEWIELSLSISDKEIDPASIDPHGDLLQGMPVLNPVLARLHYTYPVHRISPRFKPAAPGAQPTLIAAIRDTDFEVRFITLNPASMRLLEILEQDQCNGLAALQKIAQELHHPSPEQVIAGGSQILANLHLAGALLGTLRAA